MRPVNLLPQGERPRGPSGKQKGSAFVVLGALSAVLVAVVVYVAAVNSLNSNKTELSKVDSAKAVATKQVAALASFERFTAIKQTRLNSVSQLAAGRFDWERFMRELALVLPSDSWITSLDASAAGTPDPAQAAAAAAVSPPTAKVSGCARGHDGVATVLVRLRKMHGVQDVKLGESAEAGSAGGASGGASGGAGSASAAGGAGSGGGCGKFNSFDASVTFAPQASVPATPASVPVSLGGGS